MFTEKQTSRSNSTIQAVNHAFDILEIVAFAGSPTSMTDIYKQVKLPRPTAHRLLRMLTASGYIYQMPHRKYALGIRLISFSCYVGGASGVALRPILTKAVVILDESAPVAMFDRGYARYISHAPSERVWRMFIEVGNQVFLHATGVGKAILAVMSHAQALVTIEWTQLYAFTPTTITDRDELTWEIELTRERSYVLDNSEHKRGLRCVAVPVPGDLYLIVSVSVSVKRIADHLIRNSIVPILYCTADDIVGALSAEVDRHSQS